jgi:hypothetical protein
MKTFLSICFLVAFIGLIYIGCSDKSISPVSSNVDETSAGLNKVTQRPLSDFLSVQTWGSNWYNGRDPRWIYLVDYAGAWDRDFDLGIGSTFDGTITEQPLPDGTAEVKVDYRSHNVLSYVRDFNTLDLALGEGLYDVVGGAEPTIGDVHFKWDFIISAPGAPLPDLFYGELNDRTIMMEASVFGPLKAEAGMGPDGTPGHAWTNQIGPWQKFFFGHKENGTPGFWGWTAQFVKLQAVGN